jgi:surfactin synthase thioesterase subunit
MGAMVAFEAARLLEAEHGRRVAALVVSGCRAPQLRSPTRTFDLPDEDFERHLRALGGTPQAVLDSAELMRLMVPLLRADLEAAETYHDATARTVGAPILALCGDADPIVAPEAMAGWRARTTSPEPFRVEVLAGGHFFLHDQRAAVLALIHHRLAGAAGA